MQQSGRSNTFILDLMAVAVLTTTALTAGPAQAVSSNGPYYATPSWDQKLPASTRFVVLTDWNNEAVLDRETGLVWERSPSTQTGPWSFLLRQCVNRTVGGRVGWRLPSVVEFTSLLDPSVFPGRLPNGHPFTNVQGDYWTATTSAENTANAWTVSLSGTGGFVNANPKFTTTGAWCVRGPMNADAY